MECEIDDIESRFDDLQEAQRLVSEYKDNGGVLDSEMKKFSSVITKTIRTFRSGIASLDKEKVEECLKTYEQALDETDYEEKFATYWREVLKVCIYLRAAVRKFLLGVDKMKKSKIPKVCQNIGLGKLFLEK